MTALNDRLQNHYGLPELGSRILEAVRVAGNDPETLTREVMAGFEEFHIRGRAATRELVAMAGIGPADHVVDVGCGVGGPARTLAAEAGCRVTGLDLVAEYCRTAELLTERVGMSEQVRFQQGDATAMPFGGASFDAAWLQHANMNVPDKSALFGELFRVVRPGGRLALHEICAGPTGPAHYPAPWAGEPDISFLVAPEDLRRHAEAAGFVVREWRDDSPASLAFFENLLATMKARPADAPPPLGLNLLMGATTPQKATNITRNLAEDRVRVVMAVLDRG